MIKELETLSKSDLYPFHMPGHKRQELYGDWLDEAYAHDITEIDGFDDLQEAKGLIADIEDRLAEHYNAAKAYISVNGSTCGNLSAVSALVPHGGGLLMDKGSHPSVYHAAEIREIETNFLERGMLPDCGLTACISIDEVEKALGLAKKLSHLPDAVIITSPTYEGFIADVDAITDLVHSYDIPLIVDGAHGAHLAVSNKADIATVSLHKTLPAMTQVSAILINDDRIDPTKVKHFVNIYQTTSPSYILMSSAERCLDILDRQGNELWNMLQERLDGLYSLNGTLDTLHLAGPEYIGRHGVYDFDKGKINIYDRTGSLSGREIYDILRTKYRLQPERATDQTCLMMATMMDTEEGFDRLMQAIKEMDIGHL